MLLLVPSLSRADVATHVKWLDDLVQQRALRGIAKSESTCRAAATLLVELFRVARRPPATSAC